MAQYVGQQIVHLDVRPKRAVFLFRSNSTAQFRHAVERASSRWGGINEPIVPVSPGGRIQPAWRQIVEVLDPDIAFDVGALGPAAVERLTNQLGLPVHPVEMESQEFSGVARYRDDIPNSSAIALASPSILVGVKPMGVTVGMVDANLPLDVGAVEIRRWRWNAVAGIGRMARTTGRSERLGGGRERRTRT